MSVQTLLLDFSIDPARLGDESGQKAVFSQLETVLKDYVPNLILAAEVAVDGGSLKLLTGKKGTTVSVRLFDRGLVTVNIEYYKEESEEPLISFKVRKFANIPVLQASAKHFHVMLIEVAYLKNLTIKFKFNLCKHNNFLVYLLPNIIKKKSNWWLVTNAVNIQKL